MMAADIVQIFRKLAEPLWRTIQLTVSRCVLDEVTDTSGIQTVKVSLLADEIQEMERVQNFGFTSFPKKGAEGVCIFVSGNREHGVCIALDDRNTRIQIDEGQTCVYDASGSKILLKNDGSVEVTADTVNINAGEVNLGENAGESVILGDTFASIYNSHTHTGNLGAPTGPPNGTMDTALSQVTKTE